MPILIVIILSTFSISLIALIGILFLFLKEEYTQKIVLLLVGLSTGAFIGGAFLHLLPESVEKAQGTNVNVFLWVLIAFVIFFLIEKTLHWRHCHKDMCQIHTFGTMNLIGDAVHNFIDGLLIAVSLSVSLEIGLITILAIALHEIPQEIGDFGVLLHAGYKKDKALLLNFSTALMVVVGGIIGYFIAEHIEKSIVYLLPVAAGGFIYIAASDLLPEIRKEPSLKKSIKSFVFFIIGILLIYLMKFID